jgi:hypothetical protein
MTGLFELGRYLFAAFALCLVLEGVLPFLNPARPRNLEEPASGAVHPDKMRPRILRDGGPQKPDAYDEEVAEPRVMPDDMPRKTVPYMEEPPNVVGGFAAAADATARKYTADSTTWAGDQLAQFRVQAAVKRAARAAGGPIALAEKMHEESDARYGDARGRFREPAQLRVGIASAALQGLTLARLIVHSQQCLGIQSEARRDILGRLDDHGPAQEGLWRHGFDAAGAGELRQIARARVHAAAQCVHGVHIGPRKLKIVVSSHVCNSLGFAYMRVRRRPCGDTQGRRRLISE